MSDLVYAVETILLADPSTGLRYTVQANTPWDADDPLVKAHPREFSATPPKVFRTRPLVEAATARPGEARRAAPR